MDEKDKQEETAGDVFACAVRDLDRATLLESELRAQLGRATVARERAQKAYWKAKANFDRHMRFDQVRGEGE